MEKIFSLFIQHIRKNRFYEAHETVEEYWHTIRKSDHPEKEVIRGFINAAVSFELLKRGKKDGFKKVWKNYLKHCGNLDKSLPNYKVFADIKREVEEEKRRIEKIFDSHSC
ncbi:DUF309 domain-containing protein [Nitrosophilus alvini]|uniref:DUF309 domain-containing protein n=1 Tax=Nitrosophilus alvini TaxID=2714855 RepID=UPI00190C00D8|nr:DUF309 domain-containing protein [Nitrosophilus alvini]